MTPIEKFIMAFGMVEAICMMLPDKFNSKEIENPAKQILKAVQIKLMLTNEEMKDIVTDLNKDGNSVYRMVVDTYREKTHEIQKVGSVE